MTKLVSPEFEVHSPIVAGVRKINQHGSRIFLAHLTKNNTIVIDHPIERMLSWHHHETRRQIGRACIKHLALQPNEFGDGIRLIGIPVDRHDLPIAPRLQLDLRMPINTHDIDTSLPQRELDVVPDWLLHEDNHGLWVKFEEPEDLMERAEALNPYLPKPLLAACNL